MTRKKIKGVLSKGGWVSELGTRKEYIRKKSINSVCVCVSFIAKIPTHMVENLECHFKKFISLILSVISIC